MRLLHRPEEGACMVSSNHPSEPGSETTAVALERASEGGRWYSVRFNPASGEWLVPSASDPSEHRTVTVRNTQVPANSWWQRLRCNCPAGKEGLAVCWHKAAVFIRREQQRRELKYYETATGLGPRLDNYRSNHGNDHGKGLNATWPRSMASTEDGVGSTGPGVSGGVLDSDKEH